jgi:hypothetical protein
VKETELKHAMNVIEQLVELEEEKFQTREEDEPGKTSTYFFARGRNAQPNEVSDTLIGSGE